MSIEHGVDSAAGRNLNLTGKATQQAFADLACAPVGLLPFEVQNGGLYLLGQLIAVTPGPAGTVRQSFQTGFFVAVKDLIAGLARDSELSTESRHFFSVQQASHKANTFIHNRTLLPRHHSLPLKGKSVTHVSGTNCHPCVRPLTLETRFPSRAASPGRPSF